MSGNRRAAGFTLIELVIVVAIVGILAAAVLPLAHWSVKRQQEYELQQNLRIIRNAIDRYHDLALAGAIEVDPGGTGYPPDLDVLVEGVELIGEIPSPVPGVSDEYSASGYGLTGGVAGAAQAQAQGGAGGFGAAAGDGGTGQGFGMSFGIGADRGGRDATRRGRLRRASVGDIKKIVFLRRLPVDPLTGEANWGSRCYGDSIDDRSWCGRNVFDVYSNGRGRGMNGRPYREW